MKIIFPPLLLPCRSPNKISVPISSSSSCPWLVDVLHFSPLKSLERSLLLFKDPLNRLERWQITHYTESRFLAWVAKVIHWLFGSWSSCFGSMKYLETPLEKTGNKEILERPRLLKKACSPNSTQVSPVPSLLLKTAPGLLNGSETSAFSNAHLEGAGKARLMSMEAFAAAMIQHGLGLPCAKFNSLSGREAAKSSVAHNGLALEGLIQFQADREIVLSAVKQKGTALKFAAAQLQADRDVVLAAVMQDGWALEWADTGLRANKELVMAAVLQEGTALQFASRELQESKEIALAAATHNGWALILSSLHLQHDKDLILAAVSQNGSILEFAPRPFLSCKELVLAAVKQHGFGLKYASFSLQSDRDVVLAAVAQCGYALQFASSALRTDKEVVSLAMKQKGRALQLAMQ